MVSLRLLPMVPFSLLNYAAGVARVRLPPYLVGTVLGVLPGTVAIVVLGDAVTGGDVNPALFGGVGGRCGAGPGRGGHRGPPRAGRVRQRALPPTPAAPSACARGPA